MDRFVEGKNDDRKYEGDEDTCLFFCPQVKIAKCKICSALLSESDLIHYSALQSALILQLSNK